MQLPKRKSELLRRTKLQQDNHLTEAKIERMKKTIIRIKEQELPKAKEELIRTREMGDLSENAAYQEAKYHLRRLNGRILSLGERIKHAIPIKKNTSGRIQIGSTISVELNGKEKTLEILGSQETNPFKGTISHLSPLGSALMGHKAGDTVTFTHNDNDTLYHIISVS